MTVNPVFTTIDENSRKVEDNESEQNDTFNTATTSSLHQNETSNEETSFNELKHNGTIVDAELLKYLNDEITQPLNSKTISIIERIKEKWYLKLVQIVIPFFIAGFGMVGAGLLLAVVSEWDVFVNVKEIIVLVPSLLGLKGNLDMSLASRLSTQVNLGEIKNKKTIIQAVTGNAALKLLQSIVVGLLASVFACLTEYLNERKFTPENLLTIIASSVTAAAFTSVVLGSLVITFILLSKKMNINPDNVGTPIAGSLGDAGTLITLALTSSFFYANRQSYWIHITFIAVLLSLTPFLAFFASKNPFVKRTLSQGWTPIITAMLISSVSGIILKNAIQCYIGIEAYQPVVNGVGGNLVSIYAARLSTEISREAESLGSWVSWAPKSILSIPFDTFCSKKNPESKTSKLLMFLVIPGHITFFLIIYYTSKANHRPAMTPWLVIFYLIAAFIQVSILFILCYILVHLVWRLKRNPDDFCISLLTSMGDLLGVSLLYLCFHLVYLTGDTSVKVTESNLITVATNMSFIDTTNTTSAYF